MDNPIVAAYFQCTTFHHIFHKMPHASEAPEALPPIAALFLVVFDQKIGYKVSWQRSLPDTRIEGIAEYKSLPSGLHNVKEDLIYFTQDDFAGLSAFVSKAAGAADRNARFVAVGVYVPLSYGRLGRAWMHAQGLRELANSSVDDQDNYDTLEKYWQTHKLNSSSDEIRASALQEPSSPAAVKPSKTKNRARGILSEVAGFSVREHVLSPDHPALSMPDFMNAFGPLVFPLHRAALLRKRILFVGHAPIQRTCNFVYNLSIFSNIPPSLADVLPSDTASHRIKPLFNVGIHDITELKNMDNEGGWVACTTDDIIATKRDLFDVLVELSPASPDQWPKVTTTDGLQILATQRDLRRYNALSRELSHEDEDDQGAQALQDEDEAGPLMRKNEAAIIEPPSWAAIAYSSFLWWASAGESSTAEDEESEQDASLLEDLVRTTSAPTTPLTPTHGRKRRRSSASRQKKRNSTTSLTRLVTGQDSDEEDTDPPSLEETQQKSMILIAYFYRLTTLVMSGLADIISSAEEDGNGRVNEDDSIQLNAEEVSGLGLDIWSEADAKFIAGLSLLWWDRHVSWNGRGVELCGVRIC
ncbi:hypothetical protein ANO11243_088360 [Dothideomycetidae sp. 11243]|nr:hypothetical protein ANO11243_088360 [fungal sp. No.11243]